MSEVVQAYAEEGEVIMSYLAISRANDKVSRGLKVHLGAFCCKARGRWRVACDKPPGEKKQEKIYTSKLYVIEVNVLIYNPVNGCSSVGS